MKIDIGEPVKYTFTNEQGQPVTVDAIITHIYNDNGIDCITVAWEEPDAWCLEHWIPINSKNISYVNDQNTD